MKVFPHCTENSQHIFPEVKLRGLMQIYIHVFGSDLYVPTIGLIWNVYFTVLLVRTLGSTTGEEKKVGNCEGSELPPSRG